MEEEGGDIEEASNVKTLTLTDKKLTQLNEYFCAFINITMLDLQNNKLTTLPESIGGLSYYCLLYMSEEEEEWTYKDYNQWEEDGAIVENAIKVIRLDLFQGLPTHTLSDNIGNLMNLIMLNLQFNQLTTLPDSICNLTNLRRLYLNYNELTTLPENIGNLSELEILHLQNNHLSSLPDSIVELSELEWLYLQNNQLTSLPENIDELYNLFVLRLDNNNLTTLPYSITRLYNLETLNLDDNQLTIIFDELLMIHNISYENNPITIKGYDPTSQIPTILTIMGNTDPYYIYPSSADRMVSWIEQGGGVKIPNSFMGCGLNVLSCLGFIDRSNLAHLIMEQDSTDKGIVKSGMRLSTIIDMTIHEPSSFYRFFIPFGEDKEETVRFALNEIAKSLKLPGEGPYRYMIVKLVISKNTALGH
ncbi:MAG: leucine-rich repeat domain-containing protein, partial [Minisyncoccia bacterium]